MTREEYLKKKEELKQLAFNLRWLKGDYKQCQREGCDRASAWGTEKGKRYSQVCSEINKSYFTYRAGHIFMSMVRGKTRSQIEGNFEQQDPTWTNLYTIEKYIKDLCQKYEYDMNCDEKMRVIEISEKKVELEKGA